MTALTTPLVAVIIVNWNGAAFLPRCLQSLRDQTLAGVQVLLVDNGSTDDSVHLTRRDYPEVGILELGANLGYAEANNRGATAVQAPYLLFLNNDTHLDAEALARLVAAAEARPAAPILAPQLRTYDGAQPITAGIAVDVFGFPCAGKVFYADGAALFIRRDVFHELGGFDPQHFMFFEETDLCWRAWLRGYRVESVPQALVFHKIGATAGSAFTPGEPFVTRKSKRRLTHRNHIATLLKNYSTPALCLVLPAFAALTAAEILVLFASGQRSAVTEAYLPAWRDLWRARAHIRAWRRRVQATRTVGDWAIVRRMQWKVAMAEHYFHAGVPTIK